MHRQNAKEGSDNTKQTKPHEIYKMFATKQKRFDIIPDVPETCTQF